MQSWEDSIELDMIGTIIFYALAVLSFAPYVIGFILPALIKIVNKDVLDNDERYIITFLLCLFAAMCIDYKSLDSGNLVSVGKWAGIVFIEANASFNLYFKPKWSATVTPQDTSSAQ